MDARGCGQSAGVLISSGAQQLDAAALRWIQEAAHFVPATESGQPVAASKELAVTFRLTEADVALPGDAP
ncbi:MAG: TonB family protein [Steroidobacteraceae bacterium]